MNNFLFFHADFFRLLSACCEAHSRPTQRATGAEQAEKGPVEIGKLFVDSS